MLCYLLHLQNDSFESASPNEVSVIFSGENSLCTVFVLQSYDGNMPSNSY